MINAQTNHSLGTIEISLTMDVLTIRMGIGAKHWQFFSFSNCSKMRFLKQQVIPPTTE